MKFGEPQTDDPTPLYATREKMAAHVEDMRVDIRNTDISVYTRPNSGYMTIQKPVMVGSSYRDEGNFRLPVTIRYTAVSYFTEDI